MTQAEIQNGLANGAIQLVDVALNKYAEALSLYEKDG